MSLMSALEWHLQSICQKDIILWFFDLISVNSCRRHSPDTVNSQATSFSFQRRHFFAVSPLFDQSVFVFTHRWFTLSPRVSIGTQGYRTICALCLALSLGALTLSINSPHSFHHEAWTYLSDIFVWFFILSIPLFWQESHSSYAITSYGTPCTPARTVGTTKIPEMYAAVNAFGRFRLTSKIKEARLLTLYYRFVISCSSL